MPRNMGSADRIIRTIVGLVMMALVALGYVGMPWSVVAAVIAIVFLLTSIVGFCPLYVPFGISTRRRAS